MWKKTDILLRKRLNHHGLTPMVDAGRIIEYSKTLYPDLFEPVSIKNNCFHVQIHKKNQLAFTMIQGKLLADLNTHAETQKLPPIHRFKLTLITD